MHRANYIYTYPYEELFSKTKEKCKQNYIVEDLISMVISSYGLANPKIDVAKLSLEIMFWKNNFSEICTHIYV